MKPEQVNIDDILTHELVSGALAHVSETERVQIEAFVSDFTSSWSSCIAALERMVRHDGFQDELVKTLRNGRT